MTHTYATMEISKAAFDEIRAKLEAVEYLHAIHESPDGVVLDMHGIGLVEEAPHG